MSGRLAKKLDAIRKNFEGKAPAEALEVMHRTTEQLVRSGQAEQAHGVGDRWPGVTLKSAEGKDVTVGADSGPWVVTFFRGNW